MDSLSKEQIQAADDLKTDVVTVPEWGGTVTIRELTSAERTAHSKDSLVKVGEDADGNDIYETNFENAHARLAARCIIDPKTEQRMFTDAEVQQLGQKNGKALQRIYDACSRLNGLRKVDVEEAEKNSDLTASSDSNSDSPVT